MSLILGTRLGPYEILSPIGAGGMGEVYKAKDTRLDRTVAIKVLPEHLAESPERKARFEREAKAISQLNHPNICTLYDVGQHNGIDFIVMEYIEGETVAERLKRGALPLEQTLEIGIQVADALDKAHQRGVVHRDLKPGNVMLSKTGAKLLDFGLAKSLPVGISADSELPTRQQDLTRDGALLGTLHYMAPEQLEGKAADLRADLWAFGALLYEMLTRKKAFEGESQASLVGAILRDEIAPLSPRSIERVVRKCLKKDPEERWQSARDLKDELVWMGQGDSEVPVPKTRRVAPLVAAAAILASLGTWALFRPAPGVPPSAKRFAIYLPDDQSLVWREGGIAISPDGAHLVYAAVVGGGRPQLYLRPMDRMEAIPLSGTEGAINPFFSPDGGWVAFNTEPEGSLRKVRLAPGASSTKICDAAEVYGASWAPDDTIWFAQYKPPDENGIYRVPASGGIPERLSASRAPEIPILGDLLPGGKALLVADFQGMVESARIAVISLETLETSVLLEGGHFPRYVPSGHIVYGAQDALMAAPFDPDLMELVGAPYPVLEDLLSWKITTRSRFAVSKEGSLVYAPSSGPKADGVYWVDRSGERTPIRDLVAGYEHPRLSSDGRKVVFRIHPDIWVLNVARDTMTRITFGEGRHYSPIWSHDGSQVLFLSNRSDGGGIFRMAADGRGDAELLTTERASPTSVSGDGKTLVFESEDGDIGTLSLEGDGETRMLLETRFNEHSGVLSPDGRWLAYVSDESGAEEVYVVPFRGEGDRLLVSVNGGIKPMWSRDGRELFYRVGHRMMAVPVTSTPKLDLGKPTMLFEAPSSSSEYDVAADGRFVMLGETRVARIHVVLNWLQELEQLVPTEN